MNNSKNNQSNLYLVAGATGNVGGYIVDELLKKGQRVRALTRNAANADFPAEVEVVQGDLSKPETVVSAFEGVTGVHLITISDDGYGINPVDTAHELVLAAENANVKRATVLWSGIPGPTEISVKKSRLEWTILQPQEFMSNFLEWAEPVREEGIARVVFPHRKTAMIHPADIASVAVTALTEEGYPGKELVLTGPEVLTPARAVDIIAEVTGRKIRFEERTEEEERKRMKEVYGFDQDVIDFVISWMKSPPEEAYTISPLVEQITGRPASTFREWVAEHSQYFK